MGSLQPNAARLHEQLDRIFASPQFRDAHRLQKFLRFVIDWSLEGKVDQIKETTISAEVFGRADMSDDSIVRSAARRLRFKLDEYYRQAGANDRLRITIPKGGYVPEIEELPEKCGPEVGYDRLAQAGPEKPGNDSGAPFRPFALAPNLARLPLAAAVLCLACACAGGWALRDLFLKPKVTVTAASSRPATQREAASQINPVVENLVIKARLDLQRGTPEAVTQAEADYRRAIDADPQSAVGYLGLARAILSKARARGSIYRTELERDSAAELSRKALQLDPALPEAHAMLADLAMQYDWDWKTAERELRLALAETPNAKADLSDAFFLLFHGRFAEADRQLAHAQELEPLDTSVMFSLSEAWYTERRFAQMREILERILAMNPMMPDAQVSVAGSHIWEGKPEMTLAALEKIKKTSPSQPFYEAMARARAGQRDAARRIIRQYEEKYPNSGVPLQWIAKVYAILGDRAETVKWLNRSADRREWQVLTVAVNPVFAPMEKSDGFRRLKERMGLQ